MVFNIGWFGYGIALVIQIIIWSGIVYLLFNSLNQQIKRSSYVKFFEFLYIPLIFFIIKMSREFFYLPWNSCQFIWGSCIILLFTAADLMSKAEKRQRTRIWWKELGKFDYMLIGILAGSTLYAATLMFINFSTGLGIILIMFPTAWFVFLGCLQTRNEYYSRDNGKDAAQEKEITRFLSFFYKLLMCFFCLIVLSVQFVKPFGFALLLFDVMVIAVLTVVPLHAKLNKGKNYWQFVLKNAKTEYWLLFLSSVIMCLIYSDEVLLVLRAIGNYTGMLLNLA